MLRYAVHSRILLKLLTVLILASLSLASCSNPSPTKPVTPPATPTGVSISTAEVFPSPTVAASTPEVTATPQGSTVQGAGKTYYAAPNGSDSNTGSIDSPWKTLQTAVNALNPGDTLYLRSGTYILTAPLKISSSGLSAQQGITISAAPGEINPPILSGDSNGDGLGEVPEQGSYLGLVELRGSYIKFERIEVAYSGGQGINVTGSHNLVSGSRVHHTWRTGINVLAADNIVEKNTVWRATESNYCNGSAGRMCNGNWAAGIAWGQAHDSTPPGSAPRTVVRGNTVFNSSGEGIICMHSDYATIDGNVTYDNWALQIDLDQCSYATVQRNLVYATDDSTWWRRTSGPGTGIMLSNEGIQDEAGRTYPAGHDRKIINNIMVGNGTNFYFWKAQLAGSALINDLIANNTLVEARGRSATGLKIDGAEHQNSRIINNIILQSSGDIADVGSTSGLTFANNLWSKTPGHGLSSPSDVIGNPQLAFPVQTLLPGKVQAEWFRLKDSASPAIGKGLALPEITTDFWSRMRSTAPSIGAYEFAP